MKSMELPTSFSATALRIQKTFSTLPEKSLPSGEINSARRWGGPFKRRRCSTLGTTKGFVSIWVLLSPPTFPRLRREQATFVIQTRHQVVPTAARLSIQLWIHQTIMALGASQHPGQSIRMLHHFYLCGLYRMGESFAPS